MKSGHAKNLSNILCKSSYTPAVYKVAICIHVSQIIRHTMVFLAIFLIVFD